MKFLERLHRYRFHFLALILCVCYLLFPGVKRALVLDNSLSVWFLKDDPLLVNYLKFQERFGNDEVVICVVNNPSGLADEEHIKQFNKVTQALLSIPEVETVIGPGSITVVERNGLHYRTTNLTDGSHNQAKIKSTLDRYSLLKKQFYTDDFQTARFIIALKKLPDFDLKRDGILEHIKSTVDINLPLDQTFFGGIGILYSGLNKLSKADFGFFLLIGYGIMFCVMLIIYRSILVLVYALGTVALATYITLGIYGAVGMQLNLMTTLLPIIFVLVGIMDITHILNELSIEYQKGDAPKEIAFSSLLQLVRPGLFNSITTIVGFLSLLTSPMAILQSFGLFTAIGILLCFVFTYLLGIIILPYQAMKSGFSISIGSQLASLVQHVMIHRKVYRFVCITVVTISMVGIFLLKNDTYTLGYFPEDDEVMSDHQNMEKTWGPYMPIDFLVEPKQNKVFYSEPLLKNSVAFSDSVLCMNAVSDVFGYHTLYLTGLQQYHPANYERLINSEFILKKINQNMDTFHRDVKYHYINSTTNTGRITFFGRMTSAVDLKRNVDSILRYSEQTLSQNAAVYPAGYQPMYANITQYVTDSQVRSLFTASVFIFLLLWLFLQDGRLALLAVVSNFFPVIVMLGVMGLAGIRLDTATASIAVIVLSICVDDTVHFMYRYRSLRKQGITPRDAQLQTTTHIGPAIVTTGILLFCGYSFMMFGSLQTVQLFGFLTATAIITGIFGEFVVLPLLLEKFDR